MSHADKHAKEQKMATSVSTKIETGRTNLHQFSNSTTIAQRKIQELVNNSPQVKQSKKNQDIISNGIHSVTQRKRLQRIFGETVQNKKAGQEEISQQNKQENKTGLPQHLKTGVENLSGMSMDDVNVHYNSDKPSQLQAHAYAQGTDIHLGQGQEKHLPHEAWHVVQQKQGRVKPSIQAKGIQINDDPLLESEADSMGDLAAGTKNTDTLLSNKNTSTSFNGKQVVQARRVPAMQEGSSDGLHDILADIVSNPSDLFIPLKEVDGDNASAHQDGLLLLLKRAFENLDAEKRQQVKKQAMGGLDVVKFKLLDRREQLLRYAHALNITFPEFELKDPALINVAPKKDSQESKNISILVKKVTEILVEVESGKHDKNLKDIFGKDFVRRAKAKYTKAKKRLKELHTQNKIVTDTSGYDAEVDLGGFSNSREIFLPGSVVSNPTDPMSIVALFHESIHAGNKEVDDHGYIGSAAFKKLSTETKMTNAAHFEVVARRKLLGASEDYDGVFVPAGTKDEPQLDPVENALRDTSEIFRIAWTIALNLQDAFLKIYKNPTLWDKEIYSNSLPFWSKVMNLTIHKKTTINSRDVDCHPVSLIDIALAEGFTRKLDQANESVPELNVMNEEIKKLDADTLSLIMTDAEAGKKWMVRYVLENFYNLTGDPELDMKAILMLGTLPLEAKEIFKKRDVSEFPG